MFHSELLVRPVEVLGVLMKVTVVSALSAGGNAFLCNNNAANVSVAYSMLCLKLIF